MTVIYKGDSTDAFGGNFISIKLKNPLPEGYTISKVQVKIGNLPAQTIENPTFPLVLDLSAAQTRQLQTQNTIYMKVFDQNGKGVTCKTSANFIAKDQVI